MIKQPIYLRLFALYKYISYLARKISNMEFGYQLPVTDSILFNTSKNIYGDVLLSRSTLFMKMV